MPPKKRTAAQLQQLKNAQSNSPVIRTDFEAALACCQIELTKATTEIDTLKSGLAQAQLECSRLVSLQENSAEKICDLKAKVIAAKNHQKDTYRELRNERRARQHAVKRKSALDEKIAELKIEQHKKLKAMKEAEKEKSLATDHVAKVIKANQHLQNEIACILQKCESQLQLSHEKLKQTQVKLKGSKSEIYNLKRKIGRAVQTKENAVKKVKAKVLKESTTLYLLKKGVYSDETRNLIRILVEANVSNENIMGVIEAVLAAAGITAVGRVSARTVGRIIKEGYIAACIQLGYEILEAEAMTLSADGTGHKNINYNSRHANYKVKNSDGTTKQVTRFLGIERSLDGSSEQAMKDWDDQLQNIFTYFDNSPLAEEKNLFARLIETYTKIVGMHSDHCAKEKKDAEFMHQKKIHAVHHTLGEKRILDDSTDSLVPHFMAANDEMIEKAGGKAAWDKLSEVQQNERKSEMFAKLTTDLGKDSFEKLSGREKTVFKLFVWVGCGCHKDLNTVLGGYIALSQFWPEHGLPSPVLLPNKINAAIIHDQAIGGTESDASRRAIKNSQCGAIKAAKIAGDILNNKNDKSGHHDQFRIWWKDKLGTDFTFPDTSNNRFQSYCEAAAVLTIYHNYFLEYLTYAEQKKDKVRYSHMEENLVIALNDIPTRTELAVLALYAQSVSHPYMKTIRENPETNALDLGPLNKKVESFIKRIIEDPSFLVGDNVTHEVGTVDQQPWRSKEVVEEINKLAPEFPHLKGALVAFFRGALESWKRFTSEYTPGGLIDEATQEEKDLAWMPTTNDMNEGALGQFRVMMRRQPQLTLLQYNARTMFSRNKTAEFMAAMFSEDTHKYVRELARVTDTSEKERKRQIVKHAEEKIAVKVAARKKREARAQETATRIAQVKLEFDKSKIQAKIGKDLKDLVKAFKNAGAPNLSKIKSNTRVPDLKIALFTTIDLFNKGEWKLLDAHEAQIDLEVDEEEIFEGYDDIDTDWEDEED